MGFSIIFVYISGYFKIRFHVKVIQLDLPAGDEIAKAYLTDFFIYICGRIGYIYKVCMNLNCYITLYKIE